MYVPMCAVKLKSIKHTQAKCTVTKKTSKQVKQGGTCNASVHPHLFGYPNKKPGTGETSI